MTKNQCQRDNAVTMKTLGWIAVEIAGFAAGFFLGFWVSWTTLVVSDATPLAMATELAGVIAGSIYVVIRMHRLEVAGNRAVAVPVAALALGLAVGAFFYGSVMIMIARLFNGGWL